MTAAQCIAARRFAKIDKRYKYKNKDVTRRSERLKQQVAAENMRRMRKASKGK